jgi:hypothetical protein
MVTLILTSDVIDKKVAGWISWPLGSTTRKVFLARMNKKAGTL